MHIENKIVGFLLFFFAFNNQSLAQLQPRAYFDEKQELNGLMSVPKTALKDKPGVLILPAWMGIDVHAKESAEDLSKAGYYGQTRCQTDGDAFDRGSPSAAPEQAENTPPSLTVRVPSPG